MDFRDRRAIKQTTANALSAAAYDPKKLILIYCAVSFAASLLVMACSYVLDLLIANTGGLGSIGQRSILSTVQTCLELAHMLAVPFWQFGLITVTVRLIRRQQAVPSTLLEGFRTFWPVLRLNLLMGLMILGVTFAASYLGSTLFLFTPWSGNLVAMIYSTTELTDEIMNAAVMDAIVPLLGCMAVVLCVLLIPYLYRLRLSQYLLLDSGEKRALLAIRISRGLMRGKRMALFKLDLSFWWFYALEALVMAVSFADVLLAAADVLLPVNAVVASFAAYILGSLLQLGLYYWKGMDVQTAYAAFYEAVIQPQEPAQYEA